MEREIKFRFLLSTGKITRDYTVLELLDTTQEDIIDKEYEFNCSLNESTPFCEGDCITIEEENAVIKKPIQYTGLKDKNGVDIYEYDILLIQGVNYIVEFYEGDFVICKIDEEDVKPINCIVDDNFQIDFGIIIGNIYQNKELLNKE